MVSGLTGWTRGARHRHRAGLDVWTWADYLDLADELVKRTGDEAPERSAVSRAYYAAFGSAREYLIRRGASIPKAGPAHAIVWTPFHTTPDPVRRRIANLGRLLRKQRSRADYDDSYPGLSVDAQNAVAMARRLLSDLAGLP